MSVGARRELQQKSEWQECCNRIINKSNDDLMQNKGQKIIIITKKEKGKKRIQNLIQ